MFGLKEQGQRNLLVALMALFGLLLAIFILPMLVRGWPTDSRIRTRMDELAASQKTLVDLYRDEARLDAKKKYLLLRKDEFWVESRDNGDGSPETGFQRVVEKSAETALGTVTKGKVCDGIPTMQITVSCRSDTETFSKFCDELERCNPRICWENLSVRPDNPVNPTAILIQGTLRVICISDEKILSEVFEIRGDK